MNFKEVVEKLNSTSLSSIKEMDLEALKNILRNSPQFILNLAIVVISIFVSISFVTNGKNNEKKFKLNVTEYQEKLEAVKKQEDIKTKYNDFINKFPKSIQASQLIDRFSELAANRNVRILSFSPAKEKNNNYVQQITINLSIESGDYKNIILFVKDIEDYPYALRLERFSAQLSDQFSQERNNKKREGEQEPEEPMTADLEVSSIKIK